METVKTYDPKSYDLAHHFLVDDPRWLKLNAKDQLRAVDELAKEIQTILEDWLESFADGGS